MKPIAIDFARPNHQTKSGWGLLITGLMMLVASLAVYQLIASKVATLETTQAALAKQLAAKTAAMVTVPVNPVTLKRWTAAQTELSMPWENLFGALEQSRMDEVALLSVEPNPNTRTMRVAAATKEYESVLTYVERLSNRDLFENVVLVSHQTDPTDSNMPIRFVVEAQWKRP